MSREKQFCPICGQTACVRLHDRGRKLGTGARRTKQECATCHKWRVTQVRILSDPQLTFDSWTRNIYF